MANTSVDPNSIFKPGIYRDATTGFTAEEQRIAAKLLGSSEAKRLQSRRDNSRPFRHKKPVVVVEYYERPPAHRNWCSDAGGWRIDVRVNGALHNSRDHLSREDCLKHIADCERRGVTVKPIVTEWMKRNPISCGALSKPGRKSFSARFGGFIPEADI